MEQLNLSARAHSRIFKVARTLADMDGRETLSSDDVMEAIQYRSLGPAFLGVSPGSPTLWPRPWS